MTDKTAEEQRAEAYELIAKAMGVEVLRPDDQYFLDTLNLRRLPRVQTMIEEGVKNHTNGVLADVADDLAARAKLAAIRELLEVKRTAEVPSKGVQKLIGELLAIIEPGAGAPETAAEPAGFEGEAVHA